MSAVGQQPSALGMIEGKWSHAEYYTYSLTITATTAALDRCGGVPYMIILDHIGHSPLGADVWKQSKFTTWREIAIELKPKTSQQEKCLDSPGRNTGRVRIIDFSIPLDMLVHADISECESGEEFDRVRLDPANYDHCGWHGWDGLAARYCGHTTIANLPSVTHIAPK